MSATEMLKLNVRIQQSTFLVPCPNNWTIKELKKEIARRYQKKQVGKSQVIITALKLENGSELDDDDPVGSVLENNNTVIASTQNDTQSHPGATLCYKVPGGTTKTLTIDLHQSLADLIVALCKAENKTNPQSYAFLYTASGIPITCTVKERNIVQLSQIGLKDGDMVCVVFIDDYSKILPHDLEIANEENEDLDLNQNTNEQQRQVFVQTVKGNTLTISVCDSDTVQVLKNKIWTKDKSLPTPKQQTLTYGAKVLYPEEATVSDFNIPKEATLHMSFKFHTTSQMRSWQSNFVRIACTAPCNDLGLSCFMSCLYVITTRSQSSQIDCQKKLLGHLRSLTDFPPLMTALYYLFKRKILNTAQRYAIVEGLYPLFRKLVPKTIQNDRVFEYSADCWTFIIEEAKERHATTEEYQELSLRCSLCGERLVDPVRVKNRSELTGVYSRHALLTKISSKEVACSYEDIVPAKDIVQFMSFPCASEDELYVWTGNYRDGTQLSSLKYDWSALQRIRNSNKYTRIVSTLALKNCGDSFPVLSLWKDGSVVVCSGTSKPTSSKADTSFDYNFLLLLNDEAESVDLDHLATEIKKLPANANTVQDAVDERPPSEAIAVLFDSSRSMESIEDIGGDKSLRRIDIAKELFYAFSDRVMAYAHPFQINLTVFSNGVVLKHPFTPLFQEFKTSVSQAEPKEGTSLWDACGDAISMLLAFRQQYPNTKLRILCLSDGADTTSKQFKAWQVARDAQKHKIVIDSFVIGSETNVELRIVSWFSGGLSFKPATLTDARRLFEEDAVVSLSERTAPPQRPNVVESSFNSFCNITKYPYDTEPPRKTSEFATKHVLPPEKALQKAAQKKPQVSNEKLSRVRRILRELELSSVREPHPAVSVFPTEDNISFWRVLLKGPPSTPYEGGVFILNVEFPDTYPTNPPICRFQTPIYHCNVSRNGRICHSVFDRNYSSDYTFNFIMSCIYGLLMSPEPADPLSTVLAEEYHTNKQQYELKAKEYTKKYASKVCLSHNEIETLPDPYEQVKEELLGKNDDDEDDCPNHLKCPITHELFKEPVLTTWNGRTYERSAIEAHIRKYGTDPLNQNKKTDSS